MYRIIGVLCLALPFVTIAGPTRSQQPPVAAITAKYCFSDGNITAVYYADHSYLAKDDTGRELHATWQGAPGTGEVSIIGQNGGELRHDTYFMSSGSLWLKNKQGGTYLAKPC